MLFVEKGSKDFFMDTKVGGDQVQPPASTMPVELQRGNADLADWGLYSSLDSIWKFHSDFLNASGKLCSTLRKVSFIQLRFVANLTVPGTICSCLSRLFFCIPVM